MGNKRNNQQLTPISKDAKKKKSRAKEAFSTFSREIYGSLHGAAKTSTPESSDSENDTETEGRTRLLELLEGIKGRGEKEMNMAEFSALMVCFISTQLENTEVKQLQGKVGQLEEKVDQLQARVCQLEDGIKREEAEQAKRGVVAKNIPSVLGEDGVEDIGQFINRLTDEIGFDSSNIMSAKRLPLGKLARDKAKEGGSPAIPMIRLEFCGIKEKFHFFSCLKNLAEERRSWRFSQEVPAYLRDAWNGLEHQAYLIRKKDKNTKTRVMWQGTGCALFTKKEGETKFSKFEMSSSSLPSQSVLENY